MTNDKVVIVFGLFLVLMMSLYLGSQDYIGFASIKSSLSEYPYEGFSNYQEAFDRRDGLGEAPSANGVPVPLANAVPTNAVPTNAVPTNAVPTNAVPTNAVPSANGVPRPLANAVPTNAIPSANGVPANGVPANGVPVPSANAVPPSANGVPTNAVPAPHSTPSTTVAYSTTVAPVPLVTKPVVPVAAVPSFFSSLFSKEMPAKEGFESSTETIFADLQGASYSDQKPIGFMYNNKGSATCKNYGYTNSQGFVCMNENDIKLLTTRGGNASGSSDQIGK